MSTTWKSLTAGFAAGVISTAAAAIFGIWPIGVIGWVLSLGYIAYKALDG